MEWERGEREDAGVLRHEANWRLARIEQLGSMNSRAVGSEGNELGKHGAGVKGLVG